MSWFLYSQPKKRSHKKGIWLRYHDLPKPILSRVARMLRPGEQVLWVCVEGLRPNGQVLLEFWSRDPRDPVQQRYSVFHLLEDEDPSWVCEGDLGRGLVGR